MQLLSTLPITTAISPAAVTASVVLGYEPRNLLAQADFIYGSGGATVSAWLQTSLDGGVTWTDIVCFGFTTVSARKAVNLSSLTPITIPVGLTDGAMALNTAQDGLLSPLLRLKYTSTGTYVGTSLRVDLASEDLAANPA